MRPRRNIKAVILDLDDTLLSAYRRPDLAWRAACRAFEADLGPLSADEAADALTVAGKVFWGASDRHVIGRADPFRARRIIAAEAFDALRRIGRPTPAPETADRLADAFSRQRDRDLRLEPDALSLLARLRRATYRLALLTNGAGPLQRAKIDRFGLASKFDHIQIEGEVGVGKPDLAAYELVFDALTVGPEEVCVVGDSVAWDVLTPARLGCLTVLYDPDQSYAASPAGQVDVVVRTLTGVATFLESQIR